MFNMKTFYKIFITVCFLFSFFSFEVGFANDTNNVETNVNSNEWNNLFNSLEHNSEWWLKDYSRETFDLNTLFVNKVNWEDTKESKIHNFKSAIWAIVKMITWVIWWFAVLWTILWWFFILISWWNESLVTKWKKTIGFSLIWIAVSLVSYTLIQLVQMFLFSFSK